jgi:hypothetical protein
LPDAFLNQCNGRAPGFRGEGAVAEFRLPAGDRRSRGDAGNLIEKLDRRDPCANDNDVFPREFLGSSVVLGVELPSLKLLLSRRRWFTMPATSAFGK